MDNEKFGKFIKKLRKEKGITQKELGEKLNITDKAISKWERGLSFPDITMLNILAEFFEIDVSELLNGEKGAKKDIDIDSVKLQKEEVDYVKYMTKEEIEKLIDNEEMLKSHGIMFKELMKKRNNLITNAKDYLGKIVTVKIDRALGTKHPKHGFIYTVNYGYIEGTISGDGEELDAYVLGVFEPCTEFTGRVISYIHRTNDNDDKLIVVPDGKEYTDDMIRALTEFQEQYFESVIIR